MMEQISFSYSEVTEMTHNMKLDPAPFYAIRDGEKIFELRLYDEKRQRLAVNDFIEFTNAKNRAKRIRARITALHRFDSFEELFRSLPPERCGYPKGASPADAAKGMEAYYTPEAQAEWGVLGIELAEVQDVKSPDRTQLSRYLCRLLRHEPGLAGLTVDRHGWADVDELIRCVGKAHPISREILEEIVRDDPKTRYAFSPDGTRIRCNQGHSIPVDVEMTEAAPPEYLWHGTGMGFVDSIRAEGLLPMKRQYVHLSPDRETAVIVGKRHGKPFIFRVKSGAMFRDGVPFLISANGVWQVKYVPPEYLEDG